MEVFANVCESVLWIIFLKIFCPPKYDKKKDISAGIAAAFLLVASIGLSDRFALFSQYTVLIDLLITFVYAMFFLQSRWYWKVFLIGIYTVVLLGTSVLAMGFFVNILKVDAVRLVSAEDPFRVAMIMVAKLLLAAVVAVAAVFKDHVMLLQKVGVWILTAPCLAISLGVLLFKIIVEFYKQTADIVWIIWLLLLICALCIMSFWLAYGAYQGKQQKKRSEYLRKQMNVQQQTYIQQYENIRKVRKTQHDMKHRLVVIEQLLIEKDYERAQSYTKEFLAELDAVKEFKYGDNTLSTLLLIKEETARERGVRMEINAEAINTTRVSEMDLTMIVGNLLDNAIEAAEKVEDHPEVYVIIKTKSVLYISVKNRVKDTDIIKTGKPDYTTKENTLLHGFGIACIRELVDRNGGRLDMEASDGWFRTEIFF